MNTIHLENKEFLNEKNLLKSSECCETRFDVSRSGDTFEVSILGSEEDDNDVLTNTLTQYLGWKGTRFTHFELDRLPHDLILGLFTTKEPRRFSDVFGKKRTTSDDKTPDYLTKSFCFELGTSALGASVAFDTKKSKYGHLCRELGINYLILGVGPMEICSNFSLTPDEVNMIVKLYSVGRQIQMEASTSGFIMSRLHTDLEKTLKFSMSNIEENHPASQLEMSKEEWQNWSKHLEETSGKLDIENSKDYRNLIKNSIISTQSAMESNRNNAQRILNEVKLKEEYEKKVNDLPTRPATDRKKFPVPFCAVEKGEFSYSGTIKTVDPMGELWDDIKSRHTPSYHFDTYGTYELKNQDVKEEYSHRMSKEHRKEMESKGRIKVSLTEGSKRILAETGYLGKKFSKQRKAINEMSSLGYALDKDYRFDDLDEFVTNNEMLDFGTFSTKFDRLDPLMEAGGFQMDALPFQFVRDFFNTKLGMCCEFLGSLFSEINLNYRKPTKSAEFIVTQVPNYKAMLAIHNTGSNKHTFYSILVHKKDLKTFSCLSAFRGWVDLGDFMCLEMSSTRRHDISNYLFMPAKVAAMLATHMEVFGDDLNLIKKPSVSQEFFFHLLVYMSNHNQVSEVLQQIRFFYMKTNSSKLMPESLLAPLEKLPDVIRTRLCCYAIKKIIQSFMLMSINRNKTGHVIQEEDDDSAEVSYSEDFLKGIISYVSGKPLKNYEEALLLSYGGIYHNKEKADPLTSNLQIYRKLTREELKLKPELTYNYKNGFEVEDTLDMPPHGFSGPHIRNCGIALLDDMKKRGLSFSDLQQRIALALNSVTYEELATFKSSLESKHLKIDSSESDFKAAYPDLKFNQSCMTDQGKYKYGKTSRAIEGVLDVINSMHSDTNVRPFHLISDLVSECNKRGGVVAILFKKAQFGSVREIFILTMFARIVIKFVETVSRTVAECCPNEFLTKGTSKLNSTPNHYNKVRSMKSSTDVVMSVFDSLDCKTWCQNFTFPAFGNLFSVIFKDWPELSNVIRVVFNMASSKRHEMTESLMSLFIKNQEVDSMSDSMNVLKKEFLNDGGQLNDGDQSIFVKNVSNFMQGIFHYTSTVLHSSHLIMMSKIIKTYLRSGMPSIKTVIHTTKASSDDGSSLLTVILKDPTDKQVLKMRGKLLVSSEILSRSYPLACAWIGIPKSTRFVENGVEEFNSLWSFRNTVLSVPSKFTTAAVCPKITRSTIERQRTDHNSLNSCIENGCSINLSKVIEVLCALNHYTILGLDAHNEQTWKSLSQNMLEVPHPVSWLYISTPRLVGPTLGFDATLYNFLRNPSSNSEVSEESQTRLSRQTLSRRTHYVMTELLAGEFDIKSGFLIQSSIVIGKTDKYRQFLERTVNEENYLRIIENLDLEPEVLFRESVSIDEVKDKILLKAKSPGAERAFIFEDESAMHSASAYLLSTPCLTVSKKIEGTSEWNRRKMSIPAYIALIKSLMTHRESISAVESHAETLLEMTSLYSDNLMPIGRRRKVPVKIRFPKTRSVTDVSLQSSAKYMWFSMNNGFDETLNRISFSEYQKMYPWLKSTYRESVEYVKGLGIEGNVHMTMLGLLMTESDTDRTIVFMHSGRKENTIISSYLSCIEYCQAKNARLIRPREVFSKTDLGAFIDIERKLFPYIAIHPAIRMIVDRDKSDPIEKCIEIIKKNSELFLKPRSEREVRFLPNRLKNLLAIGLCVLDQSNEQIENALLNYSTGFIINYVKPQERCKSGEKKGKWCGPGIFHVKTRGVCFLIKCIDDTLTEVASSKPLEITQHLNLLSRVMKVLNITKDCQSKITEGVRVQNKVAGYATSWGAPLRKLSYFEDLRTLQYHVDTVIRDFGALEMRISAESGKGTIKAEPIRFSPSQPGNGDCTYKLDAQRAKNILKKMTEYDETNTVREFCRSSMIDRLSRLKLFSKNRLRELYTSKVDYEMDEDELLCRINDMFDECDEMLDEDILEMVSESQVRDSWEEIMDENATDILDENASMENLVDDVDLFAETKTKDSQTSNYEDLILWDDFINEFPKIVKIPIAQVITGEYLMPADVQIQKLLESLVKLRIIPEPRKVVEEESDEDEDDLDFSDFNQ
ncbi:replicase [Tulip streak virus]|uniref:RNA-directed RNA polymerase n=1 Tax=Tulip streak virus TaxID=2761348 RepID=A0A7R7I1H4_9VIRU|nr:replicase [Tulip streak virus]